MKIAYLFGLVIIGSIIWQILLPGPRVSVDHPLWRNDVLNTFFSWPYSWRELLTNGWGWDVTSILWVWPIMFFHGLLSRLGISPEMLTYLLGIIPIFTLGFYGTGRLLDEIGVDKYARWIGQLFYLGNSYFILLIDGGQLLIALAYAAVPLALAFYYQVTIHDHLRFSFSKTLLLTISVLLISIFDIRFVYLFAILVFLDVIYQFILASASRNFGFFVKWLWIIIQTFLLSGVILFGFHAYWIIPTILTSSSALPSTYAAPSQVNFLSFSSIGHSLLSLQPHWFSNVFGRISPLRAEFILIPVLVFLAPILRSKDKIVGFWLLIAIIGLFLSKGAQEPLPGVYVWLFSYIPGFIIFRDPTKFYLLITLSFSILMALALDSLFRSQNWLSSKKIQLSIFSIIILYFVFLLKPVFSNQMKPVFSNQMTGLFRQPVYLQDYQKLNEFLENDMEYGRILWLPSRPPMGFTNPIHPSVEAIYLPEKRPFAAGTLGSYETLNFLREATYSGQLLDVGGIKYVAYAPLDPQRDDMHPDNVRYFDKFLKQLSSLPWISSRVEESPIPLLKTQNHQQMIFGVNNVWWVIGSDDIYKQINFEKDLKLAQNAFIFPEEQAGLGLRLEELPEAKIILHNKTPLDLAASFLTKNELIFPAHVLQADPNRTGWWKRGTDDLIRWKEFLDSKYGIKNQDFDLGGGWAVAEGELSLDIKRSHIQMDQMLLARVLESSRSGEISFFEDQKLIGKVESKQAEGSNVRWLEIGKLETGDTITVKSKGEINVVNALAVVDKNRWNELREKAQRLERDDRVVNLSEVSATLITPLLEFEQVNSASYKVRISGLREPSFIVLSQNYHPQWAINQQSSFPVYSLFNGFRISRNGEFLIEFRSQRYVVGGIIIAGLTLAFIIAASVYLCLKRKA